jgi:hypothetical protein
MHLDFRNLKGHWFLHDLICLRINYSFIFKKYISLLLFGNNISAIYLYVNMRKCPQNNIIFKSFLNGIGSIW